MGKNPASGARRKPRTPLTPAQQGLAAQYIPLAQQVARPLQAHWPHLHDEFASAALFALVEAARTFDSARNVKFTTFARYRIWGALRDVQREQLPDGWRRTRVRDDAPTISSLTGVEEEQGRARAVLGIAPERPVGAELEAVELLEHWLSKLQRYTAAYRRVLGESISAPVPPARQP